jgi:hypothetical protein
MKGYRSMTDCWLKKSQLSESCVINILQIIISFYNNKFWLVLLRDFGPYMVQVMNVCFITVSTV